VRLFISYSRPNFAYAQLLHDRLVVRLHCEVFLAPQSLQPGADYQQEIKRSASSSTVIVLIGRELMAGDPAAGRPCFTDPGNWVHKEIAIALESKARVIPVLLDDVVMPSEADLPSDIQALARLHGLAVRDSSLNDDFERLIRMLGAESEAAVSRLLGEAINPKRLMTDIIFYPRHFINLLVMPQRIVRAFTANPEEELVRALLFLVISLILFTVFTVPAFIDQPKMLVLVSVQFVMLMVMAVASAAILRLSWRMVGGKAVFARYLSINSYYFGVTLVLGVIMVAAAVGMIRWFDAHLLDLLRRAAAGEWGSLLSLDPRQKTLLRAALSIILAGNLLLLIWTYFFWGTYREINKSSRFYSLLAFLIACVLELPVGLLFGLIQQYLFNRTR
jgi:hypothetical protein